MATITIDFGGQRLRVEYDYSPATPDVMYLRNGDPGYPGEPEEFYITKVELLITPKRIDISELMGSMAGEDGDDPLTLATREAVLREQEEDGYDPED